MKFGYGGGIDNSGGKLTLTNSQVSGNVSFKGGGIYNTQSGVITLTDSTVSGNTAIGGGGGIYSAQKGVATLINSTITGNKSESGQGGGIYMGGVTDETGSSLTLIKSTVRGNQARFERRRHQFLPESGHADQQLGFRQQRRGWRRQYFQCVFRLNGDR